MNKVLQHPRGHSRNSRGEVVDVAVVGGLQRDEVWRQDHAEPPVGVLEAVLGALRGLLLDASGREQHVDALLLAVARVRGPDCFLEWDHRVVLPDAQHRRELDLANDLCQLIVL